MSDHQLPTDLIPLGPDGRRAYELSSKKIETVIKCLSKMLCSIEKQLVKSDLTCNYRHSMTNNLNHPLKELISKTQHEHCHVNQLIIPPAIVSMLTALASHNCCHKIVWGGEDNNRIMNSPTKAFRDVALNNYRRTLAKKLPSRCASQIDLYGKILRKDEIPVYEACLKVGGKMTKARLATIRSNVKKILGGTVYANLIKSPAKAKNRKARKAIQPQWNVLRIKMERLLGRRCECCETTIVKRQPGKMKPTDVYLTGDHILPFCSYPNLRTEPMNMQLLCSTCNTDKGGKDYTDHRSAITKSKMLVHFYGVAPTVERDMDIIINYVGLNLTQKAVAERLNISQSTVSRIFKLYEPLLNLEEVAA